MPQEFLIDVTDFSKGMVTANSLDAMPTGSVRACSNADFTKEGAIRVRARFKALNTTFTNIVGLYPFYSKATGAYLLMVQDGTTLYKYDGTTATQVATGVTITDALTFWSVSKLKDVFIYASGGSLYQYEGTTAPSALTAAIKGRKLEIHKNRLAVVGDDTNDKEVIYLSEVGDPENFATATGIPVKTWRGDIVLNIIEFKDQILYAFTHNDIYYITGDVLDNYESSVAIAHMGLLGSNAICTNGGAVVFVAMNKVVYIFGGSDLTDISSTPVGTYFQNIDPAKYESVRAFAYGADIYFMLPQAGGSTVILMYDMGRARWTLISAGVVTAIGTFTTNGIDDLVLGIGSRLVKQINEYGTDEIQATGIDTAFSVDMAPIGMVTSSRKKKFKKMFLGASATTPITIAYHTDLEPTVQTVTPFTPTVEETVIKLPSVHGRTLYVTITGSKDIEIRHFAVKGLAKDAK